MKKLLNEIKQDVTNIKEELKQDFKEIKKCKEEFKNNGGFKELGKRFKKVLKGEWKEVK